MKMASAQLFLWKMLSTSVVPTRLLIQPLTQFRALHCARNSPRCGGLSLIKGKVSSVQLCFWITCIHSGLPPQVHTALTTVRTTLRGQAHVALIFGEESDPGLGLWYKEAEWWTRHTAGSGRFLFMCLFIILAGSWNVYTFLLHFKEVKWLRSL